MNQVLVKIVKLQEFIVKKEEDKKVPLQKKRIEVGVIHLEHLDTPRIVNSLKNNVVLVN